MKLCLTEIVIVFVPESPVYIIICIVVTTTTTAATGTIICTFLTIIRITATVAVA
jgi:hypothetical protein